MNEFLDLLARTWLMLIFSLAILGATYFLIYFIGVTSISIRILIIYFITLWAIFRILNRMLDEKKK